MRLAPIALVCMVVAAAQIAHADEPPRAQFRLGDRGAPHVGVPFALNLIIEGFDESPEPTPPKLEIASSKVSYVGAQPSVMEGSQTINGRRTRFVRVTWTLQWRVVPEKEGRLVIPGATVTQGAKRVTAPGGETEVGAIATTNAMKLSLALPERAVFVGESVPVTLTWVFRAEPQGELSWTVPLMAMDAFTVSAPSGTSGPRQLTFPAGSKELRLPYEIDQVEQDGQTMHRVVATFFLAPRKVGKLDVPASSVVAALPIGRPDFFGNSRTQLFRASDVARTLEVKPLPETDKPASFAGAVGQQFSIKVETSRSVVKLGEPVELTVKVASDQRLDTLALGKLDGDGGLPKDKFTVPGDLPTGELSEDGKAKTFKVVAQVTGPATEVPALKFSYFDPVKVAYQTIQSEPIALSVAGSAVVGAGEVVAAPKPAPGKPGAQAAMPDSLVDAQLALSSASQVDDRPLSGSLLWLVIGLLYAVPLALLGARSWQLRTQGQREEAAEVRAARKKIEELLDRAGSVAAREVAGPLAAALRELAKLAGASTSAGGDPGGDVLAKLETESFAQSAASQPLSADVRSDAAGLLRRWTAEARASKRRGRRAAAMLLVAGLGGLAARAEAAPQAIDEGRTAYQDAMQLTGDPSARRAAFARAEASFGEAVRAAPDRPELLADWGNAALQAGDVATATLAFRRALVVDGANARARHNLAWLRSRQSDAFRPASGGATDTLLFFHGWTRAKKLILGSAAFAIAMLLLVPWSGRRRRGLAGLSLLPLAVWLAMLASVVLEDRHLDDAVVMDDVVLRAADSAGAPAALSQPLPRGVEVTVLEQRNAWTRVRLAGGIAGWVPAGAVERVLSMP